MNLIDALRTGRPIRRPDRKWFSADHSSEHHTVLTLSINHILADDWLVRFENGIEAESFDCLTLAQALSLSVKVFFDRDDEAEYCHSLSNLYVGHVERYSDEQVWRVDTASLRAVSQPIEKMEEEIASWTKLQREYSERRRKEEEVVPSTGVDISAMASELERKRKLRFENIEGILPYLSPEQQKEAMDMRAEVESESASNNRDSGSISGLLAWIPKEVNASGKQLTEKILREAMKSEYAPNKWKERLTKRLQEPIPLDLTANCTHGWEEKLLFNSTYIACKHCGKEPGK